MIPDWMDWINKNMPETLRNDLWEYINRMKQYQEDEIYRLRQEITGAVARSEFRLDLIQRKEDRDE